MAECLRYSFWSSTPRMERVVEDLLAEPGALLKGPYVSLKLLFVGGSDPFLFRQAPLGFTPHRHQEQACERLGGRRRLSILIATGTAPARPRASCC